MLRSAKVAGFLRLAAHVGLVNGKPADARGASPMRGPSRPNGWLLAAECSLRARRKARSLKALLRTSVAASAIFAEAF
jgi:hypothetical protein